MSSDYVPESAHLVGSIGLNSVKDVYRTAGHLLGRRLHSIPDGEPGARRHWCMSQYPLLRSSPYIRQGKNWAVGVVGELEVAEGVKPEEIHFPELCYAREARSSYQDLVEAKAKGDVPKDVKFQVSLPTPLALIWAFVAPNSRAAIEPPYEKALLREVEAICAAIPHNDLRIQWDLCPEMVMWDGQQPRPIYPDSVSQEDILARIRRLAAAVPNDVDLGFHLCYGDMDATHIVNPKDATKMVELANAIAASIKRPIAHIHMPIPPDRTDDAFFQPFSALKLSPDTQIFLGVVSAADGAEGAKRRIAAASRYVPKFGVATECGMARSRRPELVENLLKIHRDISREP
jgi:methionine synthase II (cobalamin-independent)